MHEGFLGIGDTLFNLGIVTRVFSQLQIQLIYDMYTFLCVCYPSNLLYRRIN